MSGWNVRIKASVTKTIEITADEAGSEDEAVELAHRIFSVNSNGEDEKYEQDTEWVEVTI